MLSFFTVPKPFEGHIGVIQRNAIRSWLALGSGCQVIVCGDEPGSNEVSAELGTDQIADIRRNEFGTPVLSSVFRLAEERAAHRLLCYVNADLILLPDFLDAVRRVSEWSDRFLTVGEAWDLDVTEELLPQREGWEADLRARVAQAGILRTRYGIDFFAYPRDTSGPLPDFAVGRPSWDNWMIWRARRLRIPVVDVSRSALVIHQHHDYRHVQQARGDLWQGPEGDRNVVLLGVSERVSFSLDDSTHRLVAAGVVRASSAGLTHRVRTALLIYPATVPVFRFFSRTYQWIQARRGVASAPGR